MVARSMRWDQVYEWRNYRLACSLMNARKGAVASVLDPFEIEDGWFAIEFVVTRHAPFVARELRRRGGLRDMAFREAGLP